MNSHNSLPTFPIGALEVILECQEMLAGERRHFTKVEDYKAQRQQYWQMQALRPRRAAKPVEDAQAA